MSTIEYHGFEEVTNISDLIFRSHTLYILMPYFPKFRILASVGRKKRKKIVILGENLEKMGKKEVEHKFRTRDPLFSS